MNISSAAGQGKPDLSPADTKSKKGGNRNDKAKPNDTPLDTGNLDEGPAAKPTGLFLRRELPDVGPGRATSSSQQGIRSTGGILGNEAINTE